jgi:hypothetical protein
MMFIAGEWYQSGTFWTAAGVVAGLIALPVSAWVAFRVAHPKRSVTYRLRSSAYLLHGFRHVRGSMQVSLNGEALAGPHVLLVELRNEGRRDVLSEMYEAGQPIRLHVGAPVLELLGASSEPAGLRPPVVVVAGSELRIGPSLISRGQRISFTVLVDGPQPRLDCHAALAGVDVRRVGPDTKSIPTWLLPAAAGAPPFVAWLIALLVLVRK